MNRITYFAYQKRKLPQLCRERCFSSDSFVTEGDVLDTVSATEVDNVSELNPRVVLNKSGLLAQHRNVLHEQRPYKHAFSWIHETEKYQRKVFGRYGSECQIDPRICFPPLSAANSQSFCHIISEPKSFLFMLKKLQEDEKELEDMILKREEEICKGMERLEVWKHELHNRNKKKEADALAVKQKKEKLIEEVRRHFGYKLDPRDERFKEVLEQKDKEERKKEKEAKRKAKENKLLTKLAISSD